MLREKQVKVQKMVKYGKNNMKICQNLQKKSQILGMILFLDVHLRSLLFEWYSFFFNLNEYEYKYYSFLKMDEYKYE